MNKFLLFALLLFTLKASGQTCPPNIGFESGDFSNWQCYAGTVDKSGGFYLPLTGPVAGRHTIYSKSYYSGVDQYGGFPKQCPNGSNYSIQLGDAETPSIAERISYTFVVPSGQTDYTIYYYWAAVLQDVLAGNTSHTTEQKPLFSAEVYDTDSNQYITCASFSYNSGSNLPGFIESAVSAPRSPGGIVYYKNWTPASINLKGYGGHTVRLEFTARCCTPGGHFGYAYLDVNEPCGNAVMGNAYCTGEKNLKMYAPAGFYSYAWYTANFSKLLGTEYTLNIPAPPDQTKYAVIIQPYAGLGCPDTLFTVVAAINAEFTFKVPDSIAICPGQGKVDLTAASVVKGSSGNLAYGFYTDSDAINYISDPTAVGSGTYYIRATNPSGCSNILPVKVIINNPVLKVTDPTPVTYPQGIDLSKAVTVDSSLTYSYYSDPLLTVPLTNYAALHYSGVYYVKATSKAGCSSSSAVYVTVYPPPPPTITAPNTFTPNNDGVNDVFKISITGYGLFKSLTVYDRFGALLFTSFDINAGWDGTYKGKNVPVGTYYWIVGAVNTYSRSAVKDSGSISIIR